MKILSKMIKKATVAFFIGFLLLAGATAANAVTRYVTEGGAGNKDGTSWANASGDPQAMINISSSGDEVWVAAGVYLPTHSANGWTEASPTGVNANPHDKENSFVLKTGVKVYGGFAGNETDSGQRNWINNKTTLSGDFLDNDYGNDSSFSGFHEGVLRGSLENAYHVVISANNGTGTVLDGFTICGGNVYLNNEPSREYSVNGVTVYSANGGGIYAAYSAAFLKNLEIRRNAAVGAGAGIYCYYSSDLRGYNLYLFKNFASMGGGIFVSCCSPKFKNMILLQNESGMGVGIAIHAWAVDGSTHVYTAPDFINTFIHSNLGDEETAYGAGVYSGNSTPTFTNTTIAGNYGGVGGAAILSNYSNITVNNSIIWNNTLTGGSLDQILCIGDPVTYNNSLVQGLDLTSSGGLDATVPDFTPGFIHTPNYVYNMGSFTLQQYSPCVDAGSDSLYIAACGDDFTEWDNEYCLTLPPVPYPYNPQLANEYKEFMWEWYYINEFWDEFSGMEINRIKKERIDIGAFEWMYIPPPATIIRYVTITGAGTKEGTSWEDASDDIQAMINQLDENGEVWVAEGAYLPTHSAAGWTADDPTGVNATPTDKDNAFVLKTGVKVYGGFKGGETELEQRDWIANQTILTGDFSGNDTDDPSHENSEENAFHVVITANNGAGTLLDGFYIEGGSRCGGSLYYDSGEITVDGEQIMHKAGGGIYAKKSAATIRNLYIRQNGSIFGGGLYCIQSNDFRGENLYFYRNFTVEQGGGIYVRNNPKFKNIIVDGCRSAAGAGIFNTESEWWNNEPRTTPHYTNMYVTGNYGAHSGSIENFVADAVYTNCTIAGNYEGFPGVHNYVQAEPVFNNCIIWNNLTDYSNPASFVSVYDGHLAETFYNYSLVQGMDLTAFGGLNATAAGFDPKFVSLPGHPSMGKNGGSFTLQNGSPCINAGSNALYMAACGIDATQLANDYTLTAPPYLSYFQQVNDFYGNWAPVDQFSDKPALRLINDTIDIGAFEWWLDSIPPCDVLVRYVTPTGSGTKDGSSWADASDDIQAMINISCAGSEVWVAAGTYHPTHSANGWTENTPTGVNANLTDQHNAFVLKSGVKVYGGFAGNETDLSQRDWITNTTTLSGDFNGDDKPGYGYETENAYHVVISVNNDSGTLLDGFTVRGGNIYDNITDYSILVDGKYVGNKNGGGIYADNSAATLSNLEIRNNAAFGSGGGIFCINSSELRGYNLYIYKNMASQGGGMYVNYSPKFKNIIVAENQAGIGAGISNTGDWYNPSLSHPTYINLLLHGNVGSPINGYGAGMQNENSSPVITNATIVGNYGGIGAAGIYNYYNGFPVLNNTIVWNNLSTGYYVNSVLNDYNCSTTYNYSVVQGMDLTASNGLDATAAGFDPMFISAPGCWLIAPYGSFTLQTGSPCIDAGSAALYQAVCGSDFSSWDDETALTPPPYTSWNSSYMDSFFGAWYPQDDYSGAVAPRVGGGGINIGAFEETPLLRRSFMATAAETLQAYPNPATSGSAVTIALSATSSGEYIEVYSVAKQYLTRIVIPADTQLVETTIQLPAGYYILKWRGAETKLLVK